MSQNKQIPAAFLCYTHFDDYHNQGQLTEFRKLLSAEVRAQTGDDFLIFQDRDSIEWGQNWEDRIRRTLNQITFLIPVITPSFFSSAECRKETQSFLARETQLDRNDLILPLYYIEAKQIEDDTRRELDEIASAIASHHWADWRELRFEPLSSVSVRKRVAELAAHIRNALERTREEIPTPPLSTSSAGTVEARKGWHELNQAMERILTFSASVMPSIGKHLNKMNEYLERYEKGSTHTIKTRNLTMAASQLRNGAKVLEDLLPELGETLDDSMGLIIGFPSRRNHNLEADRRELSDFRAELIKVSNDLKERLDVAQEVRYKVLKLGDYGREMDAECQRMAKAFAGFFGQFEKLREVIEAGIREINNKLDE